MLDVTPEGLRIQIVDAQNRPIFDLGSARLKDYTASILQPAPDAAVPGGTAAATAAPAVAPAGAAAGVAPTDSKVTAATPVAASNH